MMVPQSTGHTTRAENLMVLPDQHPHETVIPSTSSGSCETIVPSPGQPSRVASLFAVVHAGMASVYSTLYAVVSAG